MIVFTVPFLFADLYTKYLAHIELPNQGDEIVLMKPIYAVSPIRNYGSIFKSEADKEKAHHLTHILLWPTVILGLFLIAFYGRHFLWYMALGGGLGNGIEIAIFDGGTDFLNTKTGYWDLDRWIFNVADVFLFIPVLFCLIPAIYLCVNYICKYYIYDKLLLPVFEKIGIVPTPAPPKYSEELTLEVVERYKSGETLEGIASAVDKTPNSIRGKLVSEGVYSEYKNVNFRLSQMTNPEIGPLNLRKGMEYSFDDTIQYLNDAGYLRVSQVNQEGYYSVKGGVIQVHPFGSKEAITLDYFGDQIENIKIVNKASSLTSVSITAYQVGLILGTNPQRVERAVV